MNPARYIGVLLGVVGLVLAVILALNLALGERALGSPEVTRQASRWQQATKGVTYAPPVIHSRPFKVLRLADRLPEIDTMVLGASSVMAVTGRLFPPPAQIYNLSLTANGTAAVAAEAEYVERHFAGRVRAVLIGLDWSLGFIYTRDPVPEIDLSPAYAASQAARPEAPWHKRVLDAFSKPRLVALGDALRHVVRSRNPLASFRQTFIETAGEEYRCADGELARDFDVSGRGLCRGFRYDGSFTFGGEGHLAQARAAALARAAAAPSSKFAQAVMETCGEPNAEYLRRLAGFAERFEAGGGRVLFMMPPLVPGMEKAMLETPRLGACLAKTKSVVADWAARHRLVVIDAGRSERFGCESGEFLDENHAFPECHARVLGRFREDLAAGRVAPGLYPDEGAR